MTKTIARTSKRFQEAIINAKNIRIYRLDEDNYTSTDGLLPVKQILPMDIQLGKLKFDSESNEYTLSVHSNRFYRFTN